MAISPQIINLAIVLISMQASKKIPFDNPTVLLLVRLLYVLSNVLIAGIYLYTQQQINKKRDLNMLRYVEPAPMGSTEEAKAVTTTIHAYDTAQLRALFKAQLMGVGMMGFMHVYLKYTNPLLIQSIIPLKGALEGNLVKLHLFGRPATGDLKRPFKTGGGIMAAVSGGGSGEIKTDRLSFEKAERAGRGGAKEE